MHSSALVGLLAFAAAASAAPHTSPSIRNLKDNIKNVVVLVMENRSLDNLLGGQTIKGLSNPVNEGPFCNPWNITDHTQGVVCTGPKDFDSVANDPDHAVYGNNMEFFGTFNPNNTLVAEGHQNPTMKGFAHEHSRIYGAKVNKTILGEQVMNYYTEAQVPVLTSLVRNYLTFNHWHSDVAGPTNPNRAYISSGTSYGHGTNDAGFSNHVFPQRSIWQQLTETNHTWINYWDPAGGTGPDASFYNWTYASNNTDKIHHLADFYTDAAAGALPDFSYLNPSCCGVGTTSMHPSGLISDGETLIKSVYDTLRASPQWEHTLFVLTFDESGGFHDHVPPPRVARPDNLTYTASTPSGEAYTYEFDRLGGRIPTILVSPYVSQGYVEQKGTNARGETVSYSASSLLRTLGYLWDFEPFNPRVAEAASFDHLIQSSPRKNTPSALPNAVAFKN